VCGIAGIYAFAGGRVGADELWRMSERIVHRGPDDAGYLFADEQGALAFGPDFRPERLAAGRAPFLGLAPRRLSIIDLAGGHQPMSDRSGQVWVANNGEIYNYRELRAALARRGLAFRTASDTEVILQAYLADGLDGLATLDGMFACALWDGRARRLILARDRFGVKPLYYTLADGRLVFGSEIKALLAARGVRPRLCYPALAQHFTFQNTLDDTSLFEGVFLLPPGQALVCDPRGARRARFAGWEPAAAPIESLDGAASELRARFEAAVTRQLVSDVPVGSFLSGGMDTGAIASVAARHIRPLHTFTAGFETDAVSAPEQQFDESAAARGLASELGTLHHELRLGPRALWPELARIVWHLDEPRVGISYQVYHVARVVRQAGVKVVLSGVGGDELFGGYPWRYRRAAAWRSDEEFLRGYYAAWQRMVPAGDLAAFFSDATLRALGDYAPLDTFRAVLAEVEADEPVQRAMRFDARTFLQGLFVVDDKLSMAHSVEGRVPFMDNALVAYALALPSRYCLDERDSKIVLKQAMRGLIPDAILARPKTGFTPPDSSWYRLYHMDRIRALLLGPRALARDYFRPAALARVLDEHAAGTANHRMLIWSLLCFEWWNRLFLDGEPLPAADALDSPAVGAAGQGPQRSALRSGTFGRA